MSFLNKITDINPLVWLGQKVFTSSKLLTNLAHFFSSLFARNAPATVQKFLFGIGVAAMTCSVMKKIRTQYQIWKWVPEYHRNKNSFNGEQFRLKYGPCYVLITGGANGIGYAMAREFARLNFNIVLVDVDELKLGYKKAELEQMFPEIKVEIMAADLSDVAKLMEFTKQVEELSKTIDIGIVVNNVGMGSGGPYFTIDPQKTKKLMVLNFRTMYRINEAMIPILRKRKERSAIINTTSATGRYLAPGLGAYPAMKQASDIYSQTLSIENRDKIDIISLRPFVIATGMTRMRKEKHVLTPYLVAQSVIEDLGHADVCYPGFEDKYQAGYFSTISEKESMQIWYNVFAKHQMPK